MSRKAHLNRREFIGSSAVAAAVMGFPTIIPASALGADGKPAPSERVTMGAIGLGGMGSGNLGAFLGQADCQVLAVCDVDKKHAEGAKDRVNKQYKNEDCKAYADFRELIARDDIDTISLATPDHWHAIPAIAAAKAGKDIYGEKPFSHDLREGRAMVAALKRSNRVWQTGSWQRSVPNFHFGCELVVNGRIGKVHTVEVGLPTGHGGGDTKVIAPPPELNYEMWLGPAPEAPYTKDRTHWNWRWQLDYGGGQLMDWIGHHGDIAQWGLQTEDTGPVEFEPINAEWPKEGIWNAPTTYKFMGTYANGVKIIIANDKQLEKGMGTRFIGDKGWVWVTRGKTDAEPKSLLKEIIRPGEFRLYKSPEHHRNFLDCVKSRKLTITPAEVAHRSASLGHVGLVALRAGRKLKWDPEKEEVVGDPVANAMLGRPMRQPWHL